MYENFHSHPSREKCINKSGILTSYYKAVKNHICTRTFFINFKIIEKNYMAFQLHVDEIKLNKNVRKGMVSRIWDAAFPGRGQAGG